MFQPIIPYHRAQWRLTYQLFWCSPQSCSTVILWASAVQYVCSNTPWTMNAENPKEASLRTGWVHRIRHDCGSVHNPHVKPGRLMTPLSLITHHHLSTKYLYIYSSLHHFHGLNCLHSYNHIIKDGWKPHVTRWFPNQHKEWGQVSSVQNPVSSRYTGWLRGIPWSSPLYWLV